MTSSNATSDDRMLCAYLRKPPRKRRRSDKEPSDGRPYGLLKQRRQTLRGTEAAEPLTQTALTTAALEEHNRQTHTGTKSSPRIQPPNHSPPTQSFLEMIRERSIEGGPDLSDLRGYPFPEGFMIDAGTSTSDAMLPRRRVYPSLASGVIKGTDSTSVYSQNFVLNLIDHGINPIGTTMEIPNNWREINKRVIRRRPSLSLSKFTRADFERFVQADVFASKTQHLRSSVVPLIEGNTGDASCVRSGCPLENLAPLIDGTSTAHPDVLYGAHPEDLDPRIRRDLNDKIIPFTQHALPVLPNFFLEVKGPGGTLIDLTRQACYDGALGARGINCLQSYKRARQVYDNNAYTVTAIYHGGLLKLFTTHLSAPKVKGGEAEYIMTQLRAFCMTDETQFREGAAAYRNARDWAKDKRDELIRAANERLIGSQSGSDSDRTDCCDVRIKVSKVLKSSKTGKPLPN
ncbi:predicted protein [Uncinocarpus reesii 1704]|uniref:Uncharacterized protein n=1 Tax=Uncinocarpus reesii (strain UAMH 1704) TaxID=336963 RepID=C4JTP2_UNCRE|nr:uncharacterized protein UREG_05831 [Uncinocarpus reesii 1704]EEP80989.1 predicted protein [Uncinocarpus reesii 1704]